MFANALLAATPANKLALETKAQPEQQVSTESISRMERELASLQMQIKIVEEDYGPDVLHLTVIKGYLSKLLVNAAVVRWLARHQPEYLKEFQRITEMTDLSNTDESPDAG